MVTYPAWISIYLVDFCSNCPMVKMLIATHPKPAKKPAVAPQLVVVLALFKNMAKLNAITMEKRNVSPKTFAIFPFFMSSSEKLFSAIHIFPKSIGEYQRPPIRKFDNAATTIANQLSVEIFMVFHYRFDIKLGFLIFLRTGLYLYES